MLRQSLVSWSVAILSLFASTALLAAELIVPVSGRDLLAATDANDYFLKKHSYSATRYRIVRVNLDSLLSNEQLTITLFDDERLVVNPIGHDYGGNKSTLRWSGMLDEESGTLPEGIRQAIALGPKSVRDAYLKVKIFAAKFEHDIISDANFPFYPDGEFRANRLPSETAGNPIYFGIGLRIVIPDSRREYVLRALEMGGPFHLVYERDRDKVVKPRLHGPGSNPEIERRRQAKRDFMEALGEDPRLAILRARVGRE